MLTTEQTPELCLDAETRRAKRVFEEVWSDAIAAKQNWQRVAFLEAIALTVAIVGLIHVGTLPKTINYVAPTLARNGSVIGATAKPVDMDQATWTTAKIQSLTKFLESWRTVTTDRTAQANNWDRAFSFVGEGSQAKTAIAQWFEANDPFKRADKGELVSIKFKTFDGAEGKRTFGLWWEETTTSLSGQVISVKNWRARVVYDMHISAFESVRQDNPLGVLITELSFQEVR